MNVCPFNWGTSSQRETVDDHISWAVNTRFVAPSKHVIITMTYIIALVALNLHLGSRGAVNALMNVFRKRRERVPKRLEIYTFFWWAGWVPHGASLVFKYKTNFDETFELYSRRQFISHTVLHVFDFRHRNPQWLICGGAAAFRCWHGETLLPELLDFLYYCLSFRGAMLMTLLTR